MIADPGTYILTGQPVNHAYGGAYTLIGTEVFFNRISPESGSFVLSWPELPRLHMGFGVFSLTGMALSRAESGVFSLIGTSVLFNRISVESGNYTLTGTSLGYADPGVYTITGSILPRIHAASAVYSISGDADLGVTVNSTPEGILVYIFSLTGSPDIDIPIKSLQAKLRAGTPTYLQVVIPDIDYLTEIYARSTGKMKIDIGYKTQGVVNNRSTIIETDLEDINVYRGKERKTITLVGYSTSSYSSNIIKMTGASYIGLLNGYARYRFSEPNVYLKPGSTEIGRAHV